MVGFRDRADLEAKLDAIDAQIDDLCMRLQPVIGSSSEAVLAGMPPLHRAKMQATLAYVMNALFYTYLRLQGAAPQEHPVHRNMKLLQQAFDKISAAEQLPFPDGNATTRFQPADC